MAEDNLNLDSKSATTKAVTAGSTTDKRQADDLMQREPVYFVIKKSEKIAHALYILTNYLPNTEPFKINLRQKGLDLIDALYQDPITSSTTLSSIGRAVAPSLEELEAVLKLGSNTGLMSPMNVEVLIREIDELLNLFRSDLGSNNAGLPDNFFQPEIPSSTTSNRLMAPIVKSDANNTSVETHLTDKSNTAGDRGVNSIPSLPKTSTTKTYGSNHQKRQAKIVNLFNDKEEIDIKDVEAVIEGCSQKTMQRELKSLVETGTLLKHGKRRWSSYTLASDVNVDDFIPSN